MNEKNNILSKIGMQLHMTKNFKHENSLKKFTELLLEIKPDVCYEDFCILAKEYFAVRRPYGENFFMPQEFKWFVKEFSAQIKPNDIYVPFATGLECDLFEKESVVQYHFYNKDNEAAIKMLKDIKTVDYIEAGMMCELIVSALPLGNVNGGFIGCQIVEKCIDLLSDNGYCVFTFAKNITSTTALKWLSELESKGLYCNAIIDLPIGTYAPLSMIDSEIVIFSKRRSEEIFTGLIEEEHFVKDIIANFINKRSSASSSKLGVYVKGDVKCYSDYLKDLRIRNKSKTLAKTYNGRIVTISQIGEVKAPNKNNEFENSESAIYVPRLGNSPVVTNISDFHIKPQNYFQVVVNSEVILPRFLAFFLNTEDGVTLRQLSYKGNTIKAFNTRTLGEMVIPCPSIALQSEYLKTYEELEGLSIQVETLKYKLIKTPASYKNIRAEMRDINNTGDKFVQWIESLPYPIATILKRYSESDDVEKKQETLFYFFEAYAIFEATVLSAVLNKKLVDSSSLGNVNPSFFEKASFGNWVIMDRSFSNLFLKLINSTKEEDKKAVLGCFKTSDENLIKLLCNKNICNILESVSKNRNLWKGHSGITSDALYKEHVDILDSDLRKLQKNIKDLYERVRLIRPVSLEFTDGIFYNKVEILTGSNPIFEKHTIESLVPLDTKKLYLQMIDTEDMVELPPYFILKNSPVEAKNACYFYNRVESGSTRYVSYHYEGIPEDMEAGEVAFDHIKELLTVSDG